MKSISRLCWLVFITFSVLLSNSLVAQEVDTNKNYTAYEFMSKYYNEDFKPFKKKNIYVGLAFSLENKQKENTTGLLQNIVDGNSLGYNLELKSGYYISNNTLVGFNFLYNHNKFTGVVFRDPDTVQSHSISRSYDFTPNIRPSIPLTSNDRLSFFIEIGLTFGYSSALVRDIKNIDVIDKKYTEAFHFRAGISPGVTFFAMESFAFEVQLNLIGYELSVAQQSINNGTVSKELEQKIDANIDILSLSLGLSYYFGSKKK